MMTTGIDLLAHALHSMTDFASREQGLISLDIFSLEIRRDSRLTRGFEVNGLQEHAK